MDELDYQWVKPIAGQLLGVRNKRQLLERARRGEFPMPIRKNVWRCSDVDEWQDRTLDARRRGFPEIPTFLVTRDGRGLAEFTCPVCSKKNLHGTGDGHRQAHCGCWERGYYLVTASTRNPAIAGGSHAH
jgi:hypothetical protein